MIAVLQPHLRGDGLQRQAGALEQIEGVAQTHLPQALHRGQPQREFEPARQEAGSEFHVAAQLAHGPWVIGVHFKQPPRLLHRISSRDFLLQQFRYFPEERLRQQFVHLCAVQSAWSGVFMYPGQGDQEAPMPVMDAEGMLHPRKPRSAAPIHD